MYEIKCVTFEQDKTKGRNQKNVLLITIVKIDKLNLEQRKRYGAEVITITLFT